MALIDEETWKMPKWEKSDKRYKVECQRVSDDNNDGEMSRREDRDGELSRREDRDCQMKQHSAACAQY